MRSNEALRSGVALRWRTVSVAVKTSDTVDGRGYRVAPSCSRRSWSLISLRVASTLTLALIVAIAPKVAAAEEFSLTPGQSIVGKVTSYVTRRRDTLLDIAVNDDLGYTQLVAANKGINPWLPGPGRRIVIPNSYLVPDVPRRGIVINLAQQRLFYFPRGSRAVQTFPIGIGVVGRSTPLGDTRVVDKQVGPTWYPTPSMRAEDPSLPKMVPPGPDNPLGDYALALGWPDYLIHGTNKPYGIGRMVSNGCIHLYPADIASLFEEVAVGTPVRVISETVETAWSGGALYVAVFPDKTQTAALDAERRFMPAIPPNLVQRVLDAAGGRVNRVDWHAVTRAGTERTGVPVRITPSVTAWREQGPNATQAARGFALNRTTRTPRPQ